MADHVKDERRNDARRSRRRMKAAAPTQEVAAAMADALEDILRAESGRSAA